MLNSKNNPEPKVSSDCQYTLQFGDSFMNVLYSVKCVCHRGTAASYLIHSGLTGSMSR